MRAKVISVVYEAGDFQTVRSHSRNSPGRVKQHFLKKGYSDASSCGSGWEQYAKGSKLTLIVEIDGQRHEIWLTPFFHGYYDRLTTKVRNVIEQTRPDFIDAVEQTRQDGQCYFTASDADFAAWLERVRSILGR